jgi:transcriptional regulator with XRE-family HTH domain
MKKPKDHIGQKIKRIRAFKGMNQEELARAIGKTRSLISHFERTGNINKYTLREIADALQIDVETIENIQDNYANYSTTGKENALPNYKTGKITEGTNLSRDQHYQMNTQLQNEISFLKDTINHQWQLLHELAKKK